MRTVFQTNNGLEAIEVQAFLAAYGIDSVIVGKPEDRSGAFHPGHTPAPVRVMVMEESYQDAAALLESRPDVDDEGITSEPTGGK